MKAPVAVALIVMGGLLVVAPIISDYFQRAQASEALARPGVTSVDLSPEPLSAKYRGACWILGAAMIVAAIRASWKSQRGTEGSSTCGD